MLQQPILLLAALLLLPLSSLAGAPVTPESAYNDAGYIDVNKDGKHHMFYWMFESRGNPSADSVIMWMSGGPGCSSSLALFGENGPLSVNPDLTLTVNPNSWTANATVVWVDQPVGTGFSYGEGLDHNEDAVASDMTEFVRAFMKRYPKYAALDFYVYGESYAGHYVPVVAKSVMDNLAGTVNLRGAAIGNGLTNPMVQYQYYAPFAHEHGLVTERVEGLMYDMLKVCEPLIAACNNISHVDVDDDEAARALEWEACIGSVAACNLGEVSPVSVTGVNVYDVRVPCGDSKLCYDFSAIDAYMNQPDVQAALGVDRVWKECRTTVEMGLVYAGDWMKHFEGHVAGLLEGGKNVLIYAGEYDFICNWLGNFAWTKQLSWSGAEAFNAAPNTTWTTSAGVQAGSFQSAGNFTFLKVKNAGHMVPRDQPFNSLDMVRKHTTGFWVA